MTTGLHALYWPSSNGGWHVGRPGKRKANDWRTAMEVENMAETLFVRFLWKIPAIPSILFVSMVGCYGDAWASCGHRPGTPDRVRIQALSPHELQVIWRNTTGKSWPERTMWFDIAIRRQQGADIKKDGGGGARQTDLYYHDESAYVFGGLQPNTQYCVTMRARTEGSREGCVSEVGSGSVCGRTLAASAGRVAPYIPKRVRRPIVPIPPLPNTEPEKRR